MPGPARTSRTAWLDLIDIATTKIEHAIQRERATGAAPPGIDARPLAEELAWQSEQVVQDDRASCRHWTPRARPTGLGNPRLKHRKI